MLSGIGHQADDVRPQIGEVLDPRCVFVRHQPLSGQIHRGDLATRAAAVIEIEGDEPAHVGRQRFARRYAPAEREIAANERDPDLVRLFVVQYRDRDSPTR